MMDVMTIERMVFTDKSTIGDIRFDGVLFCKCLELSCRKANPEGKMAILPGRYQVVITKSPKFGYFTPELLDVPSRSGIRIHTANFPEQLEGCIAPGFRSDTDAIYDSKAAYNKVFAELEKRLAKGAVYVSVIGGGQHVSETV